MFQIILSSVKFCSNILISTKPLSHIPLPKQTIATLHIASICTIVTEKCSSSTSHCPLRGFVLLNQTSIMPRKICYLTVCSLVCRLGKQAVSSGTMKRPCWNSFIVSWCMFFKTKSQFSKKFLVTPFLNKKALEPWIPHLSPGTYDACG